jgi:hypothetical protein
MWRNAKSVLTRSASLFDRMSAAELDVYAREGILPDWFTSLVGAIARPEEARND